MNFLHENFTKNAYSGSRVCCTRMDAVRLFFAIASRIRLKRIAKCTRILRSSRAIYKQSLFARKHVNCNLFSCMIMVQRGPGSVVGIATGYGLDGPGIESRWRARLYEPVQTGPGTHPASCTMGTGSVPGVKSGRA